MLVYRCLLYWVPMGDPVEIVFYWKSILYFVRCFGMALSTNPRASSQGWRENPTSWAQTWLMTSRLPMMDSGLWGTSRWFTGYVESFPTCNGTLHKVMAFDCWGRLIVDAFGGCGSDSLQVESKVLSSQSQIITGYLIWIIIQDLGLAIRSNSWIVVVTIFHEGQQIHGGHLPSMPQGQAIK